MKDLCSKWAQNQPWWFDYVRTTDDYLTFHLGHFIRDYLFQPRLRYMIFLRYAQTRKNALSKLYCEFRLFRLCRKYGIEIKSTTKIGRGFVMTHPYNITISPDTILGDNVNILKGATIGRSAGSRPGVPRIGNQVYIGLNSTVIGGITIGDNVLIAPNTLVNVDVPSHSVVIGTPCRIIHREDATKEYLSYLV